MIVYYGISEAATALGVSRQRAAQLLRAGGLPPHDAVVLGDRKLWEATHFDQFARRRKELLARTPIGLRPQ